MIETLHFLLGGESGAFLTAIFFFVGVMDVALYRFLLAPNYDRLGTPEAQAAKKMLFIAMHSGAAVCFLVGLGGLGVQCGLI